jgi:hypothetical protein
MSDRFSVAHLRRDYRDLLVVLHSLQFRDSKDEVKQAVSDALVALDKEIAVQEKAADIKTYLISKRT